MARSSSRRKSHSRPSSGIQAKLPDAITPVGPASPNGQTLPGTRLGRPVIFISYSHRDRRWVDRLLVHLKPLERYGRFSIWDDSRIRLGTRWRAEIAEALDSAAAAILVVSADFLASDFVMNEEIPSLLRSTERRGTAVIPLIVAPSLFNQSVLRSFQGINSPEAPLSKLSSYKRDEILVNLATSITATLDGSHTQAHLSPGSRDAMSDHAWTGSHRESWQSQEPLAGRSLS
jgi:hypothetical protein